MKYEVIWKPPAEEELTRLWLDSPQPNAVKLAADDIDRLLQESPMTAGESRSDDRRILLVAPLGVIYRVIEPDHTVNVLQVWCFKTGGE